MSCVDSGGPIWGFLKTFKEFIVAECCQNQNWPQLSICNIFGKAISITHCECVFVAFGIQHAMRFNHIVICGLRGPTIFFHTLIQGKDFRKTLLKMKRVFWFSLQPLSDTFLILSRNEREIIINLLRSSCKVSVIPVRFKRNLNFLDRFSKKN